MVSFLAKVKIFRFYNPWFDFLETRKSFEKRIPSEGASQGEQKDANISFVAHLCEELGVFKVLVNPLH